MSTETDVSDRFDPNLHLLNLATKGAAPRLYLETKWRLVWFREEHPDWGIETSLLQHDTENHSATFRATVTNADGRTIATGHCCERLTQRFADYFEKAETQAIGRALAAAGFGTQFAPDMDEERVVDSPMANGAPSAPPARQANGANAGTGTCETCHAALKPAEIAWSRQFGKTLCALHRA